MIVIQFSVWLIWSFTYGCTHARTHVIKPTWIYYRECIFLLKCCRYPNLFCSTNIVRMCTYKDQQTPKATIICDHKESKLYVIYAYTQECKNCYFTPEVNVAYFSCRNVYSAVSPWRGLQLVFFVGTVITTLFTFSSTPNVITFSVSQVCL